MAVNIENLNLPRYFKLLENDSDFSRKDFPETNELFSANPELFLKVFLTNNGLLPDSSFEKTEALNNLLGKGRNALEEKNKTFFVPFLRRLLISEISRNWDKNYNDGLLNNYSAFSELLKNTLMELFLLTITFQEDNYSYEELLFAIYPSPDRLKLNEEKEFILSLFANYKQANELKNSGFEPEVFGKGLEVPNTVNKDLLSKVLSDLLNFLLWRSRNNENYEMFCVLSEEDNSTVLVSSLEIFHQKKNLSTANHFAEENLLITSFENVPDIKGTRTEKILRENFKKVLDYIIKQRPELKSELYSDKYLFTLKPVDLKTRSSQIEGDSLNLPLMLLLLTAKLFLTPVSTESGICATGNLIITPDSSGESILIGSVRGFNDKITAIRNYNHFNLYKPIKTLFVPDADKINFKTALEKNDFQVVSSYEEVSSAKQMYLKAVRELFEIDFIDPFVHYLKEKSYLFENLLNEGNLEEKFNSKYESIKDFLKYINLFTQKEITLKERRQILVDPENDYCLLDKDGIIIPSFVGQFPKDNAELFCSFLAWQRLKLQFTRTPVPVLLPLTQITRSEQVYSGLLSLFSSFKIPDYLINNYFSHNSNSFVFIIYDENAEKVDNLFRGDNLISELITNHFVIACANSIEQANFWNDKVSTSKAF